MKKFILITILMMSFNALAVKRCEVYSIQHKDYSNTWRDLARMNQNGLYSAIVGGSPWLDARNFKDTIQKCFTGLTTNNNRIRCKCVRNYGIDENQLSDLIAKKVAEQVTLRLQERNDEEFNLHRQETFALHNKFVEKMNEFVNVITEFISSK
jgi:hypothetical protein